MKTFLITGVAGFIGSNLCEVLLKKGFNIIGIDNLDNSYEREIKIQNMKTFLNHKNFVFQQLDIVHDLSRIEDKKVDLVIHLAAKSGVQKSLENSNEYISNNIIGTMRLLEYMKKINCKKLIFTSSSSVYGNIKTKKSKETDKTDWPISTYAMTKKSCELLAYDYYYNHSINSIVLRLFSVYGKKQRPDLALSTFINRAKNDQQITVYNPEISSRDFTEISDVIHGILLSVDYLNKNKKVFEIFNIGTSKSRVIFDVAKLIFSLTNKELNIFKAPQRKGDIERTCANITKAKRLLGYNPTANFNTSLRKLLH